MAVLKGSPAISSSVVESDHILLLSNEMLYELARVLRYPRMLAVHGLSENRIYDYVGFLREAAEIVAPNPLMITPIRDVSDRVVMQTAVIW
jgi:predicted nucleic acid-binding protein